MSSLDTAQPCAPTAAKPFQGFHRPPMRLLPFSPIPSFHPSLPQVPQVPAAAAAPNRAWPSGCCCCCCCCCPHSPWTGEIRPAAAPAVSPAARRRPRRKTRRIVARRPPPSALRRLRMGTGIPPPPHSLDASVLYQGWPSPEDARPTSTRAWTTVERWVCRVTEAPGDRGPRAARVGQLRAAVEQRRLSISPSFHPQTLLTVPPRGDGSCLGLVNLEAAAIACLGITTARAELAIVHEDTHMCVPTDLPTSVESSYVVRRAVYFLFFFFSVCVNRRVADRPLCRVHPRGW